MSRLGRRWGQDTFRAALLAALLAGTALSGPGQNAAWAQPIRLIPPGGQDAAPAAEEAPVPGQILTPPQSNTLPQSNTMPLGSPSPGNAPQVNSAPPGALPPPSFGGAPRPGAPGVETQSLPVLQAPPSTAETAPPQTTADGKTPDFVIQPLKAPDPASTGLLDDSNGGLGMAMWQGSTRAQAQQALGVLPAPVSAPALRELQRRLLLSTAEIPQGTDTAPGMLGLRVQQLVRLGRVAEAERLSPTGANAPKDTLFRTLPFELALLKNDTARACALAAEGLRDDPAPLWQKATVFCRYTAKDIPGGDLALSLWRDGSGESDAAFYALANILRGDARAKLDAFGQAVMTPLHFAMLRASGRPLPKDALDAASPAVLVAIAGHDKADAETRLMATERAVNYGVLPADVLAEAYSAVEISDAQRATLTAGIASGKDKSVRAAAFLYQSARNTTEPKTRAELIKRAYDLAVARNLLLTTAAVYRPILNGLVPNEGSISAAPAVIRMGLAAGDVGLARLWRNTLMALPPERDNAGEIAAEAWPLLLIAGEDGEWRDSRYEAWQAAQKDLPQGERIARAAQLLTLVEAAGIPVPPERWDSLLNAAAAASAKAPPVAIWRNLQRAAAGKAKAETTALSLAMLGGNGLDADGQSLATALEALRTVGLNAEARQIALEAALLRGL